MSCVLGTYFYGFCTLQSGFSLKELGKFALTGTNRYNVLGSLWENRYSSLLSSDILIYLLIYIVYILYIYYIYCICLYIYNIYIQHRYIRKCVYVNM